MNKRLTKISKYLSFILRHNPAAIGLQLDPEGWLSIDELIKHANAAGKSITRDQVQQVVATSEEQRFVLSDDGLCIRAIQIRNTP
jgi:putative RNA 2'-phosphotransferase